MANYGMGHDESPRRVRTSDALSGDDFSVRRASMGTNLEGPPNIMQLIEVHGKLVAQLAAEITTLGDKLNPILLPDFGEASSDMDEPSAPMSDIASGVTNLSDSLTQQIRRLVILRERVQL